MSGYNGAFSAQPYLLEGQPSRRRDGSELPGRHLVPEHIARCQQRAGHSSERPRHDDPIGVNTLFLVDTQRMSAAFGSDFDNPGGSGETIMSDLNTIACDSAAGEIGGVIGGIVPVDSYASVQQAYAAWNANPCSVDAANGVVAAIAAVVDQLRSDNPTIQNVVIVGGDDQIPFARLADGATQSNERDYGAATFAGENNVEADALSLGYYFSDDPYARQPAARRRQRHPLHPAARRRTSRRVGIRDRDLRLTRFVSSRR